jgi:hypothetical protein
VYSCSTLLPILGPLRPCSSQPVPSSAHFHVSGIHEVDRHCPAEGSCHEPLCTASTPGSQTWKISQKRTVSIRNPNPFLATWYLPYHIPIVGTSGIAILLKVVRMGRHLVVLLVWVASCAPHGYHTSVSICATVSLSPTPRRAPTLHVSELYPGGGFRSNTESEKEVSVPCIHYRSNQTQRGHTIGFASIIYAVLVRSWLEISMG